MSRARLARCFASGRSLRAAAPLLLLPALAAAAPAIRLSPSHLNFGRVAQHQVFAQELRITNEGDEALLISDVYTSCSCTEIVLHGDTVPPGGSTILDVTFHSRDLAGENNKTIEISSNDPLRGFLEIPLIAFVAAPILVTPADRALDFGKVLRGETPRLAAEIVVEERDALNLSLGEFDGSRFTVEILANTDPRRATLAVSLRADAMAGPFRQILRLATDDPRMPVLDFELTGTVRGDLAAKPSRLNFRFVKPGQDIGKELTVVAAASDIVFRIIGGETDLPGLTVTVLDDGATGPARIRVAGQAIAADDSLALAGQGRIKGNLRLFTDLPAEPVIQVDLLYMLR